MPATAPRRLPSPLVIAIVALAGVMFALTLSKGVRDSDYFWHLATGNLIAHSGRVPSVDPFSFTWSGQPWTPHEWLSELLIYLLVSGLGAVGALAIFALFPGAIFTVIAAAMARRGARANAVILPLVLGAFALIPYVTLRPQAISWLFLAGLIWLLLAARPEHPRRLLWLIPYFVLWANLHGLYVVGIGVVGLYMLFTLAGRTPMSASRGWVLGVTAGVIGASMFTPAGPIGILYPLRYVDAGDWGLAHIQEWQSPDFHNAAHWAFLALIVAVGLNGGRRTPGWLVALSWIGITMGLVALRNIPVAVVFSVPTLILGLESRLEERDARRPRRAPAQPTGRRVVEMVVVAAVVIGSFAVLVPRDLNAAARTTLPKKFPVAAVDMLVQLQPDANVLTEYGWGGYVISRVYDRGGHVFVDGRNDMYSQQILEDYSAIRAADPGWQDLVARYGVQAIILPPDATLTRGPATDAGWCEVYRDATQVLLLAASACP
jgi:hypothetical protein